MIVPIPRLRGREWRVLIPFRTCRYLVSPYRLKNKPARFPFNAALTFCISRWKKLRRAGFVNTERVSPHLTAKIVRGYVRHHRLGPDQLPDVITTVHRAMGQLGQPPEPEEVRTPAVSIRQSVRHDYVVCLDCGYRGKTLRRHIGVRHSLTGDEYRQRWGLRSDHPLTAPAYSECRSALAKELGWAGNPRQQPQHRRQRNLLWQMTRSKSRRALNRGGPVAPDQSPM